MTHLVDQPMQTLVGFFLGLRMSRALEPPVPFRPGQALALSPCRIALESGLLRSDGTTPAEPVGTRLTRLEA
ncbi:MAG: hypothetical protein OXC93_03990 [Rhodospirillaceae bacterium]|nr:hypothetical protein [Rhodospirillaceae bacterium]